MRRQSKKRRERMDAVRGIREAYLEVYGHRCVLCGAGGVAVHEISDGPNRSKSLSEPYTWLCLCWTCNSVKMKDAKQWPEAKQLALQYLTSPSTYDLKAYNKLVNERAPLRITQSEVDAFIKELIDGGVVRNVRPPKND